MKSQKSMFSTFSHKSVKSVESCINGWMDLGVDLSELIAAHLVYMNPNVHGHSFFIQCDISLLLKSTEIFKSRAVATLTQTHVHAYSLSTPSHIVSLGMCLGFIFLKHTSGSQAA